MTTANGSTGAYRAKLDRMDMKREGDIMTLTKPY